MINDNKRIAHKLNLQMFAEPNPEPTPDPQDPPVDPPKTFTQAELDDVIAKRIERERKKYGDYDEIKAKLSELENAEAEREKAKLSETERLESEKAEALKAAEDAKAERDKALTAANQRLIKAEFRATARELKVRTDALDDAYVLADLSAVTVDDDGNVVGMEDVVKALLTNKPFLADQPKPQPKRIGDPSGGIDPVSKTKEQLLAEAKAKAEKNPTPDAISAYTRLKRELS